MLGRCWPKTYHGFKVSCLPGYTARIRSLAGCTPDTFCGSAVAGDLWYDRRPWLLFTPRANPQSFCGGRSLLVAGAGPSPGCRPQGCGNDICKAVGTVSKQRIPCNQHDILVSHEVGWSVGSTSRMKLFAGGWVREYCFTAHWARGLVHWLKLPAWKVGDRGFEPHSGLQISKKQNCILAHS